jgi:hypothetical protein
MGGVKDVRISSSTPYRHSSESWNPAAFAAAVKKRGIPAFAGMTKRG